VRLLVALEGPVASGGVVTRMDRLAVWVRRNVVASLIGLPIMFGWIIVAGWFWPSMPGWLLFVSILLSGRVAYRCSCRFDDRIMGRSR
jgi:hypothetical protein